MYIAMKEETKILIKTERRRDTFGYIIEIIQRGKLCPKKFHHDLTIPAFLYEEVISRNIVDFHSHYVEGTAFLEYDGRESITISFLSLWACEDIHTRILRYLVIKFAGDCPIIRSGRF